MEEWRVESGGGKGGERERERERERREREKREKRGNLPKKFQKTLPLDVSSEKKKKKHPPKLF